MTLIQQFFGFVINGGVLGVLAIGLHAAIFQLFAYDTGFAYAIASLLTYIPLIVLNFFIQRRIIFATNGRFWRFVMANMIIMAFVSAISPLCRSLIAFAFGDVAGDLTGFILAAVIGATPSFVLARYWVFVK